MNPVIIPGFLQIDSPYLPADKIIQKQGVLSIEQAFVKSQRSNGSPAQQFSADAGQFIYRNLVSQEICK